MRLSYTIGICVLERFQSHLEEDKYDTETDGYEYDEIDGYYVHAHSWLVLTGGRTVI